MSKDKERNIVCKKKLWQSYDDNFFFFILFFDNVAPSHKHLVGKLIGFWDEEF